MSTLKLVFLFAIVILCNACATSPYYGQFFPNTTSRIPIQVWSIDKNDTFLVECSKAGARGSFWGGSNYVTTISLSQTPIVDPNSGEMFGGSAQVQLPRQYWRDVQNQGPNYSYPNGKYISSIRILRMPGEKKNLCLIRPD